SSIEELPDSIMQARRHRYWTTSPLLQRLTEIDHEADLAVRDRVSLALLNQEPTHATYLAGRVMEVVPAMQAFIVRQMKADLNSDDQKVVSDLMAAVVTDDTEPASRRLNAAVGLARLEPNHDAWDIAESDVCRMLVQANPVDLGQYKEGLVPICGRLTQGLRAIRLQQEPLAARTATFLLAELAGDDHETLIKLLEESSIAELSAIAPAIAEADDGICDALKIRFSERIDALEKAVEKIESSDIDLIPPTRLVAMNSLRITLARQIGNLGTGLMWLGEGQELLPHLGMSDDPTVRSYLIECYASSRGHVAPLVKLLTDETGNDACINPDLSHDVASALLLTLGSLPSLSQDPATVRLLAMKLYQETDDALLHASAKWLLDRLPNEPSFDHSEFNDAVGYVTSQGQLMVRLPGDTTATIGSSEVDQNRLTNEDRRQVDVPAEIYFSRRELTIAQLERFRQSQGRSAGPGLRKSRDEATARLSFFEAAEYCNWLSRQDGIPENQWCYEANSDGVFASEMRIKQDHLQRSGYQIPTPDLWEYACRAGTSTPRPYGHGTEFSSAYIRWMGSRQGNQTRGQQRKPNGFGLFDMLGDSSEWSVGVVQRPTLNARDPGNLDPRNRRPLTAAAVTRKGPVLIDASGQVIRTNTRLAILGGAFDSPPQKTRSSDRSVVSPPYTNQPVTLRLMRIVP
ncbi:MAG: formylglycine-generating enzyme family protein, partial [Planctomycetota bacterium]